MMRKFNDFEEKLAMKEEKEEMKTSPSRDIARQNESSNIKIVKEESIKLIQNLFQPRGISNGNEEDMGI